MANTPIVKPLGLAIQTAGLVNAQQVQIALEDRQLFPHLKIGQIMARRGWISQQTADFFAEQWPEISNQELALPTVLELKETPDSYIKNCLLNNQTCEPSVLLNLYWQIRQQREIIATGSQAERELIQSGLVIASDRQIKLDSLGDRYHFDDNWIQQQLIRLQPYSKIRVRLWGLEAKANDPYRVIAEVNNWTGGHPWLNQKVYQVLRDRCFFIMRDREATVVSELVCQHIIDDWQNKSAASHLLELRHKLLNPSLDLRSCLHSYQKIWHGRAIAFDRSPQQRYLIEIGLIKLEQNRVRIASRIYRHIFDRSWLKQQLAIGKPEGLASKSDRYQHLEQNPASVNQQKSSGLIKILTLLVCLGGVSWFGSNLLGEYQQIKQLERANNLLVQQKYTAAIDAYDRLLTNDTSKQHLIWINRGYAFSGLNQYQDMLESCSNATAIEPQAAMGWNCQGEALYHLGQYPQALSAFEQASVKNPQEATFWLNKTKILSVLQQHQAAVIASQQAIQSIKKSSLDDAQKQEYLAIAFERQGHNLLKIARYQESLPAFEQALSNIPHNLSAQKGKGISLYELGDYSQAIAIFNQILQRNNLTAEQEAISWLYIGVSHCQEKRSEAARSAFTQVLKLTKDPRSIEIARKGCGIY